MVDTPEGFYIDYSSLDDFQRKIIDGDNDKSMMVKGNAGTGKSLIALHKARQIAALGKTYLIVVYTKTLKQYFADGLKTLGLTNVFYYKEFERGWRGKWKWEMERGTIRPVDYLIVDECQDFSKEEIAELKICGNICFFFGDSAQSIMYFPKAFIPHITQTVEETAKVLGAKEETLFYNYRLTKQTAALAEKVRGQDGLVEQCVRKGQKPYLVNAQSFDKQLDKIANMINNGLNNVGILLPYNRIGTAKNAEWRTRNPLINVEYVKDYLFSKGITCEFKYDDEEKTKMDLDFHTDNPKIMTWWCAKGIQFKNIFIPGCESYFFNDHRNAFYVAITRSCERLFLGYSGSLNQFLPDTSSELYDNPSVRKTGNVPLTYQEMGGAIVEVVPNTF